MTKTNQKHPKAGLKANSKNTSHIERVKTELITLETIEKPFKGISVTRTMRIIKEDKCPKLSPRALGGLIYNIGYTEDEQAFHFRITANSLGGYFSKEWVALKAIQAVLDQQKKESPFKAITLKGLYKKRGANNHGFLAAVLRAEKILGVIEKQPLLHTLNDFEDQFTTAMNKLIEQGVDLPHEVAEEARKKAILQEERLAKASALKEEKAKSKEAAPEESLKKG